MCAHARINEYLKPSNQIVGLLVVVLSDLQHLDQTGETFPRLVHLAEGVAPGGLGEAAMIASSVELLLRLGQESVQVGR